MKLSEAIRLGALLRPQGRGTFIDSMGRTCAFGAAMEASGVPLCHSDDYNYYDRYYDRLFAAFPLARIIMERVWEMNDVLGWSRERIADWVATVENEMEAPVTTETPACSSVS